MKTYNNLYPEVISFESLILAWKRARKGKTRKQYVIEFESEIFHNLMTLHYELKYGTYMPKPLITFILRDPKTRKISKSDFRDRIVHHALVSMLEPLFDKTFIYDSCANQKKKGNIFALKRFEKFIRKVTRNGKYHGWFTKSQVEGYCLKADIRHYFEEVDLSILLKIIRRKVTDKSIMGLIEKVLMNSANFGMQRERDNNWVGRQKGHASR